MRTTRWRIAVLAAAFGLPACGGGGSEECGSGELIFGSLSASCPSDVVQCVSWEPFLAPRGRLVPDRTASTPRTEVRMGSDFGVGVHTRFNRPANCTEGQLSYRVRWRTTDPSVLRIESGTHLGATVVAVGPGTARVVAENIALPGGQTGQEELTVCADEGADDFTCPRVPLDIHVTFSAETSLRTEPCLLNQGDPDRLALVTAGYPGGGAV